MKVVQYDTPTYEAALRRLDRRHLPPSDLQTYVAEIIGSVRQFGDKAVLECAAKYDGATLAQRQLAVTAAEFAAADKAVSREVKAALKASLKNVHAFAKQGLRKAWKGTNTEGAEVGEVYHPFQRVGIYVPGGSAPLISTVIMTVALASAAGVPEIVVCSPCGADGKLNINMLHALQLAGATEVYRIGGAHAVAAMACGTRTIRAVDKILGPGNKYVVEAKRQLFGVVAIDLLPGPSEIMVLADDSANPEFIAADLLAQAEHGTDSQAVLATPSLKLLRAVEEAIEQQLVGLPRGAIARASLATGCTLVQTKDVEEAVRVANAWAPEHLSLVVKDDAKWLPKIRTSGAIFVGPMSPVAAGDFMAGPSHTLPTGGAGKSFPGLTVDQFQRRTSIVKYSKEALKKSVAVIERFAAIEGLEAHGRSARIRFGAKA
jgi:histidinol dehydrogenase